MHTAVKNDTLYLLRRQGFKVLLPVAPSFLTMHVNISGGCKALACSLTTMEIKGIALRLTGMLAEMKASVKTCNQP